MNAPQPMNILFLENYADTREMVTVLLKQSNIDVVPTDRAGEVLRLMDSKPFDAFLLDGMAPEESSIRLCRILKSQFPRTPVIFYSGEGYASSIERAMAAGATAYLVKPFHGDLAREIINYVRAPTVASGAPGDSYHSGSFK